VKKVSDEKSLPRVDGVPKGSQADSEGFFKTREVIDSIKTLSDTVKVTELRQTISE
jgi:hypothetical protein